MVEYVPRSPRTSHTVRQKPTKRKPSEQLPQAGTILQMDQLRSETSSAPPTKSCLLYAHRPTNSGQQVSISTKIDVDWTRAESAERGFGSAYGLNFFSSLILA
ncbi:hypothetical protein ACMFMG_009708 [Clarireedia jacksonii]